MTAPSSDPPSQHPQMGCRLLDVEAGSAEHGGPAGVVVDPTSTAAAAPSTSSTGPAVTQRPRLDDRHRCARVLDLGQLVARHEHGAPLVAEPSQQLADLADAGRVEAVGGLVEHQERRVLQRGGGQARAAGACRASSA